MRQEHYAHIRQTHLIKGNLIKDLLRCGDFPGHKVGVILVVALAERSRCRVMVCVIVCTKSNRSMKFDVF